MAEYIVAKSIAYAFADSPIPWAISRSSYPSVQITADGFLFSESGEFELTLQATSNDINAAFVSVNSVILKEANVVDLSQQGKDYGEWCTRYATKIRAGSTLSVWVKKDSAGVHRGAVLTIRKLPSQTKK